MKKLLFITHDASRTGAPMLLLNLLRWFAAHKKEDYDISVMCVEDGELLEEYKHYATTILFKKKHQSKSRIVAKVLNKWHIKKQLQSLKKESWDLIFSNTIVNGKMLELLKRTQVPVITYVHELQFSIELFLKRGQVQGTLKNADYYLCGSKLVQQTLINQYHVKSTQTKVVNSFVEFKSNQKEEFLSSQLKKELDIPEDALVVGMMGSFIWRKGADFFIETAKKLQSEQIYFIWVGANNPKYIAEFQYDLEQLNCTLKLKLIPPSKEYKKYFNMIDDFYLSSREDPYPMVMVEASSFGIPILCFENTGGAQEFIDEKTGYIIPYGNITAAAEKLIDYHNNRTVLSENCEAIKTKSKQTHDVMLNAPVIETVINELLDSKSSND